MIGKTLSHYKVLEKLGQGGMGEVYLVEDTTLERQVALKILPAELASDPDRLARFEREAKTLAALDHPNIVSIHSIEEADGVRFLTMELVEGERLAELIPKSGMPVDRFLELAIPLADALAAAHDKGAIHRDLKPANIMVTGEGRAKILDFGLTKWRREPEEAGDTEIPTESLTEEGLVVGTLPYMSPEQLQGKPLDHRSDIFSFGALLYEMATGRPPFRADSSAALISKILRDSPYDADVVRPEVPHQLGRVIRRCLEKDPGHRFQTARDVRNELKDLQRECLAEEILAEASSRAGEAPPAVSRAERRPPKMWIVGGLVLVAVVSVVLLLRQGSQATALTEGDSVLLTDFVNRTGDPVFDGTLKQALAIKLEESPYLDIYPERQVQETLQFMGLSPDEMVTQKAGQEICERQGIKALVTGEIAALGENYAITLSALECRGGLVLSRHQAEAEGKEGVLSTLGAAAVEMRKDLGESLASLEKFDAPVEQATTSSLEALKAFSLGVATRTRGSEEEAIPLFKRAIELDPDFAMAYARLGTALTNYGESKSATEYQRQAFALRDRVSERERLYITGHYYGNVTGEIDKQIETYEVWRETYPADWSPVNNLSALYLQLGWYDQALEEAREAVQMAPNRVFPYTLLMTAYRNLGRLEEAKGTYEEARALGFSYWSFNDDRYQVAYLEGDAATMQQELESVVGTPAEARLLALEAARFALTGRMSIARRLTQRAMEAARRHNFQQLSASIAASEALTEAFFENSEQALDQAETALGSDPNQETLGRTALIYGLAAPVGDAKALIDELAKEFPRDTIVKSVFLPNARAALTIGRGNYEEAVKLLEAAARYERANLETLYLRGQALLLGGDGEAALAEFQKIHELESSAPLSPLQTLAYLGIARSHRLMKNLEGSLEAYEAFFELTAESDPDVRIFERARTEYRELVEKRGLEGG